MKIVQTNRWLRVISWAHAYFNFAIWLFCSIFNFLYAFCSLSKKKRTHETQALNGFTVFLKQASVTFCGNLLKWFMNGLKHACFCLNYVCSVYLYIICSFPIWETLGSRRRRRRRLCSYVKKLIAETIFCPQDQISNYNRLIANTEHNKKKKKKLVWY